MTATTPSMQAPLLPQTVEMPPPPRWAIDVMSSVGDLKQAVSEGFRAVNLELDAIKTSQAIQGSHMQNMGGEIGRLSERVKKLEDERATDRAAFSARAREPSQHDLEARDALKSEKEARERLEKKFDEFVSRPDSTALLLSEMKEAAKEAAKKPWAQKLGTAALGVALLGLALLGATLKGQLDHLERKPEAVQPAPTVYIPVPTPMAVLADGGAK